MKNLVIPDFKEGSDKKTLGQILNIPRSSIPEYLSNARYGADAALGPGNNGMNAKDSLCSQRASILVEGSHNRGGDKCCTEEKSRVKGIEGDDHAANIHSFIHAFPRAY